jgi:hypothetical protein
VAKPETLKVAIHRFIMSQPILGQGVQRKTETYRGTELHTITVPGREAGLRAYAFVGDYLVLGTEADLLKKCIDAQVAGDTLATVARYQVFHKNMPAQYLGMFYMDLQGFAVAGAEARRPPGAPDQGDPFLPLLRELRGIHFAATKHPAGLQVEAYTRAGVMGLAPFLFWARAAEPMAPVAVEERPAAPGAPIEARPEKRTDF